MKNISITEAIVSGNYDRDELSAMYHLTESEVADVQQENDRLLNDEDVSEEEYQEWCDKIDETHGDAEVA